ncbi:hypothetical protein [Luethyella okanaganae]|uniref:Uncharacterized protein n=1 Tax=Luethyella okanaganae TaxID=69372 RepID=A0ABW1VGY5_9MICO
MKPRHLAAMSVAALTAVLVLGGATAAYAETDPMQEKVDQVLADYPGGVQTAYDTVEWDGGAVELTIVLEGSFSPFSAFSPSSPSSIGECATGSYCAFAGFSYTGSRLSFTSCPGGGGVSALGTVRSVANARSTGTVTALNGGSGVFSLAPNTGKPVVTSVVTTLSCA